MSFTRSVHSLHLLERIPMFFASKRTNVTFDLIRRREDSHLITVPIRFQTWMNRSFFVRFNFWKKSIFLSRYDCVDTLTGFARAWMLLLIFFSFFLYDRAFSDLLLPHLLLALSIWEVYTHGVLTLFSLSLSGYVTSIFLSLEVTAVFNRWLSGSSQFSFFFPLLPTYGASLFVWTFCRRATKEWYARQTPRECLISISSCKWVGDKVFSSFIRKSTEYPCQLKNSPKNCFCCYYYLLIALFFSLPHTISSSFISLVLSFFPPRQLQVTISVHLQRCLRSRMWIYHLHWS